MSVAGAAIFLLSDLRADDSPASLAVLEVLRRRCLSPRSCPSSLGAASRGAGSAIATSAAISVKSFGVEARSAADTDTGFHRRNPRPARLGGAVSVDAGDDDARRRIDALRLLQQVPAIVSISLVDQAGTERVFVSRLSLNRTGRGADMSADPAVVGARDNKVWYGPVQYHHDSEPYMRIAVAGNLRGRRRCHRRHQPETDLGRRCSDQDRRDRACSRRRRFRASDRPPGYQPGSARRRSGSGDFGRIKHLLGADEQCRRS